MGYYVRGELQRRTCDPPLVLAAIEHCPSEFTASPDLRRAFGLTRREARVAMLLADRQSNREIAQALCVTEHTARRHTENVLLKLGIHRRTDVRHALMRYNRSASTALVGDDI